MVKKLIRPRIRLGSKVRDIVTGFEGVALSRVEYMNGCVQICVKPPVDKAGKMQEGLYIDIEQLEIIKLAPKRSTKSKKGGSQTDSPRDRYYGEESVE